MPNRFQIKRTTTSGLLPNVSNSSNTTYIAAGELAINLTDKKLLSSNGSATFEVGANLATIVVGTAFTQTSGNANFDSGLLFVDGTNDRVGIGTSSPSFALDVSQSAPRIRQTATTGTNSSLIQLVNSGGTAYVGLDSSVGGLTSAYSLNMYHSGAYPITFSTSGTERMRIDSAGNLLVGTTTSPGSPNAQIVAGGTTDPGIQLASTSGGGGLMLGFASGGIGFYTYTGAVGSESYTDRMRLNSSGNLGIGTTSPSSRLEASGADCVVKSSATSGYAGFYAIGSGTNNSYLFLGNTTSGEQGRITSENGGGLVFSNGSGATERMRIDSSGKVLVGAGATASLGKLVVSEASSGTAVIALESQGSWNSQISSTSTGNFIFTNGGNERMRIDSAGSVGIARTPDSSFALDVGGEVRIINAIGSGYGGAFRLYNSSVGATNPAKHFRIGSTGTLELINNAYSNVRFQFTDIGEFVAENAITGASFYDINNSAYFLDPNNTGTALNVAGAISLPNNKSLTFRNAANTANAFFILQSDDNFVAYNAASTPIFSFGQGASPSAVYGANANNRMIVNGSSNIISFNVDGTEKLTINGSGNLVATGNVTAFSDIRVKDNVENITDAIGKLNQIRGVTYTRIDLDDKERKYAGVIAQEIEQVLPEAVFDNGKVKSVDYNATIALLIEAVKEQQGQINELKLTIEQLKGN